MTRDDDSLTFAIGLSSWDCPGGNGISCQTSGYNSDEQACANISVRTTAKLTTLVHWILTISWTCSMSSSSAEDQTSRRECKKMLAHASRRYHPDLLPKSLDATVASIFIRTTAQRNLICDLLNTAKTLKRMQLKRTS